MRIDDGHHFIDVLVDETVEENLVPVLQRAQIDELVEVGRVGMVIPVGALELFLDRAYGRWQQAVQCQLVSFSLRERRSLVEQRVRENLLAPDNDCEIPFTGCGIDPHVELHDQLSSVVSGKAVNAGPRALQPLRQ
jgi:hypothetical protein